MIRSTIAETKASNSWVCFPARAMSSKGTPASEPLGLGPTPPSNRYDRRVRGGRRRPPRHRPGDPFIKGPIVYTWIASACRLPGAGLHVAMAYRFHRGRFRLKRRGLNWGVSDVARGLRLSVPSTRRGLHTAELAGLLAVEPVPQVASRRSLSWISRSRRPARSVGRCTDRSLGAGGSRPPGSRGKPSKLYRSLGS
jgi:hypothetical protein